MTTLLETFEAAGFVGPVLLLCALLMWWSLGARWYTTRGRVPDSPVDAVARSAEPKTLFDVAVAACVAEARQRGTGHPGHLAAVAQPYKETWGQFANAVHSTVAVAPLAGLLGTVTGMIETFDSLGSMVLFSRGGGIGAGISEAMISTQMGLVVAVPGVLLGAALDRRQTALEDQLDNVVQFLAREGVA